MHELDPDSCESIRLFNGRQKEKIFSQNMVIPLERGTTSADFRVVRNLTAGSTNHCAPVVRIRRTATTTDAVTGTAAHVFWKGCRGRYGSWIR